MKLFLNLITLMLVIAWALSYFIFQIGPIAHMILLMAMLVVLMNIIRAGLYA